MEWRPILERPSYEVSDTGLVRRIGGKILKPDFQPNGYLRVRLYGGNPSLNRLVHRLVAEAFIPNPDKYPVVNHVNGIRTTNDATNLEWVSILMNANARVFPSMTRRGRAVVQLDATLNIIRVWDSAAQAARSLKIHPSHICVACKSPELRAGDYYWRYDGEYTKLDDEIWRPWEFGSISNLGRIRSMRGALVYGSINNGYIRYNGFAVHRIVAEAFPDICPRADGSTIVNHKDGKRINNAAINLEWTTPSGNCKHAYDANLNSNRKPVRCITSGITFRSVTEAAQQTKAAPECIIRSCKSTYRTAAGLRWEYAAENRSSLIDDELVMLGANISLEQLIEHIVTKLLIIFEAMLVIKFE